MATLTIGFMVEVNHIVYGYNHYLHLISIYIYSQFLVNHWPIKLIIMCKPIHITQGHLMYHN